jgi:hypothetical protein
MSLESMKSRLNYQGGTSPQSRMINDKLKSMLFATKHSYQAANFQIWSEQEAPIVRGLFNPVTQTENFDTKMISTEFKHNYKVGTYFRWENTDTYWICFLQDKTELAYFRGECRQCNFKVKWVDKDRRLLETLVSVIGPSEAHLRKSSSMQAKVAEDFPNAGIKVLAQDNPLNRGFFHRYQIFLIQNTAYIVEQIDTLSLPGILQLQATEHYANLVEDDIEHNIRNVYNVQPIIPEHPTEYAIEGSLTIKPQIDAVYNTSLRGGQWVIIENMNLSINAKRNPATLVGDVTKCPITVVWNSMKSGMFTLGYLMPNGDMYQKAIFVESLF